MRRVKHKHNYEKLANFLRANGYQVQKIVYKLDGFPKWYHWKSYTEYLITGKNIIACYCTPNNTSYKSLSGAICADHKDCFDKWSKCPVRFIIKDIDYKRLLEELVFLGTQEGFNHSNSYDNDWFVYQE